MSNDDSKNGTLKPKYSLGFKIVISILAIIIGLAAWARVRDAENPTTAIVTIIAIVGLVIGRLATAKKFHDNPDAAQRSVGGKIIKAMGKKDDRDRG